MRYILAFLMILLMAGVASADPRMEINDDFCHFIMDAVNTDNEMFVGDCSAKISVSGGLANGYASVMMWVKKGEADVLLRGLREYVFTSADSDTACTMVESNGTEYTSNNWRSEIRGYRHRINFKLVCIDGTN